MPIVTYEDVKAHLNLSNDSDAYEIQGFIDAASGIVEREIGPVVPASFVETQFARGSSTLVLNHAPVVSVDSVTEFVWQVPQVLVAESFGVSSSTIHGYAIDEEAGVVRRYMLGHPTSFLGPVTVSYTAGLATIPAAVKMATLVIVAHLWQQTQRGSSALPSLGGMPTPIPVATVQGSGIPPLAMELLHGYDSRGPKVA